MRSDVSGRHESGGSANPASKGRVVITGGAGFLGSTLSLQLLDRGFSVCILDSLLYGDQVIDQLRDKPNFEFVQGDLRDPGLLDRTLDQASAVVHLGAIVGDSACSLDRALTESTNLVGTQQTAEAARSHGVRRFIFASSCSVYGASDVLLDEASPLRPASLYVKTKVEGEQVLRELEDDGFRPTILRFGSMHGLSPRPRFDLAVNLLTARAWSERHIEIHGGGQWRPFLHVADAATAVVRCLEVPESSILGQTYNIGSDSQNLQIDQLGRLISQHLPGTRVARVEVEDAYSYRVSFARARRDLGFEPVCSVEHTIGQVQGALERGQIADYTDPRYSNARWLAREREMPSARDSGRD